MKKKIFAISCSVLIMLMICISAFADSATDSFYLSTSSGQSSSISRTYKPGNAVVNTYAQHWKGSNVFNADSARTQITSSSSLSQKWCKVEIYSNGNFSSSNEDSLYAETATGLWEIVSKTKHYINVKSNSGETGSYEFTGNNR